MAGHLRASANLLSGRFWTTRRLRRHFTDLTACMSTRQQTRINVRGSKLATGCALPLLQVRVRGKRVFSLPQRKHYFALNKPKGYLCSNSPGSADEGGAANLVTDLFADWLRQVRSWSAF